MKIEIIGMDSSCCNTHECAKITLNECYENDVCLEIYNCRNSQKIVIPKDELIKAIKSIV